MVTHSRETETDKTDEEDLEPAVRINAAVKRHVAGTIHSTLPTARGLIALGHVELVVGKKIQIKSDLTVEQLSALRNQPRGIGNI